jgi:predicted methyltransferase
MKTRLVMNIALCIILASTAARAQFTPPQPATEAGRRVQALLSSEVRSAAARESDSYRKPVATLEFFGLEPGMKVIEFIPAGGYYTEILAHALAGDGELQLLGYGANAAADYQGRGMRHVKAIAPDTLALTQAGSQFGIFTLEKIEVPIRDADLFLTFRNLHNISEATRPLLHRAVFNMLKRGAIYGIIDHTKRHNEPDTQETWRRLDPVKVIKEVEAAGFEFVDYSGLHYRPDDELKYDTTRPSINRYSDRFTLKFRKP